MAAPTTGVTAVLGDSRGVGERENKVGLTWQREIKDWLNEIVSVNDEEGISLEEGL